MARVCPGLAAEGNADGLGAFSVQTAVFSRWRTGFVGEALVPVVYVVTLSALWRFWSSTAAFLGVPILLAGLMLNMLVISANAGRMSASAGALTGAGRVEGADQLRLRGAAANCDLRSDFTRLNMLGDNIVIRLGQSAQHAASVT
jgi:hypothetical protein